MLVDGSRNEHAAGGTDSLQAGCDVHTVTIQVVTFNDDVAKIDTNPEGHLLILGNTTVAVFQGCLKFHCCTDCFYRTRKFRDHAISGRPEDSAAVFQNTGVDDLSTHREHRQSAFFISAHLVAESNRICSQDRSQFSVDGCHIQPSSS